MKPPNPGGLDISAESQTAFETSAGEDRDAQLDTSKLANAGVVKPAEPPKAGALRSRRSQQIPHLSPRPRRLAAAAA